MRQTWTSLLLQACLYCVALLPVAQASEVSGLYEAMVPVAGQSAAERQRAVAEGFRQVVVKLSGQRSVLANPVIQAEAAQASALLESYRYEAPVTRQPGQPVDPAQASLRLRMGFDTRGVSAVLQRAAVPVWASSRPSIYLWVGRDTPAGRQVFGPDTPQGGALLDGAGLRGLPVVLSVSPLLPVEAAPVPAYVADAATRAGARVILAATLGGAAGRWRATGVLSVDGVPEPVDASGSDEFGTLRELMAVVADRLGARYAVAARGDALQMVRLRVSGVADLGAHAGLAGWLRGLPLVRDVVTERVAADAVDYLLTVAGTPVALQELLAADGRLAGLAPAGAGAGVTLLDAVLRPAAP